MMAVSQTITFTAIPDGMSLNAERLPVSVLVSPRLVGSDRLGSYRDWLHWTGKCKETGLEVTFECNGQTLTLGAQLEQLRPELWDALFNQKTFVRSHQFNDYSGKFIASYPVRAALSSLKSTYQAAGLALALPTSDVHKNERDYIRRELFRQLVGGYEVNWDTGKAKEWRAEQEKRQKGLYGVIMERGHFPNQNSLGEDGLIKPELIEPGSPGAKQLQQAVVQPFAVYSHMPQGTALKRESLDDENVLDFHQALTSLNTYREIQRVLGLVFDFELPAEFVAMTQGNQDGLLRIVRVAGNWDRRTKTRIPETATAYRHALWESGDRIFVTAPRNPENPQVFGLLNLEPGRYGLAQVDVDGGLHKSIILAETMNQAADRQPTPAQHSEVFDPATTLSSLRSGGISLFADSRALSLLATFDESKTFNDALENDQPQPRPFSAEDLVRGYRLDVWDAETGEWHSLHRRNGVYTIGQKVVKTRDEEGFMQLAATQVAPDEDGKRANDDLYLHEAIARWNGWSLSADMPGKHLTRAADPDHAVPDPQNPDPENEPVTPFKMTTKYEVAKGSLPRLRFGGRYRIRARVVDLAGNSLQLEDEAARFITPGLSLPREGRTFPYLRYEPVVSPFLLLRDELGVTGPGSAIDRLVIRTFNSSPDLDTTPADLAAADRHITPPRGSVEMGERHGIFDDANGRLNPSPAMWQLIKQRDEGKFDEVQIASIVIDGEAQWFPLEPAERIDKLPYLPDPLARGAALRNLPGTAHGTIGRVEPGGGAAGEVSYDTLPDPNPRPGSATLVSFDGEDDWQKVVPFRLALSEGDTPPGWDPTGRKLTVFLPKGETRVTALSSYLDPDDLKLMGVWQWLREYIEFITTQKPETDFYRTYASKDQITQVLQLAVEGGHWMLTPPQLLTLVHAVQQPLGIPDFTRLTAQLDTQSASELQTIPESDPTAEVEMDVLTAWRKPGDTDAYLVGGLQVHGASTAKVDVRAEWVDPVDDLNETKPGEQAFSSHVEEVPLTDLDEEYLLASGKEWRPVGYYDPEHDLICFARDGSRLGNLTSGATISYDAAPRHQIGDTRHHVVSYTATATSRYREYFPQEQDGVPLDFTRSSSPASVHVPASTRPLAPQVVYVIPTFGWQRETRTNLKRSVRRGGGLRVYLDRPWWSSGEGELLGVACWGGGQFDREDWKAFVTQWGQDPIWQSATLGLVPRSYAHFPDAVALEYGLPLEAQLPDTYLFKMNLSFNKLLNIRYLSPSLRGQFETHGRELSDDAFVDVLQSGSLWKIIDGDTRYEIRAKDDRLDVYLDSGARKVNVAGHEVAFDEARGLWYCDLTVDSDSATYSPFVRLALVRYQPYALIEAKLSRVVLADFVQLAPERAAMVTADPNRPGRVRVVVSGPAPRGPQPQIHDDPPPDEPVLRPTQITVKVQERDASMESDLAWRDAPEGTYRLSIEENGPSDNDANLALWAGVIQFRRQLRPNQYRLLIEEREYVSADYNLVTETEEGIKVEQAHRLVYAEYVMIDEALLAPPSVTANRTEV